MERFVRYIGIAVPLRRASVDTDQVITAKYLKRISRHGYEDALFASWRDDSEFVLNREPYRAGSVLVAGPDFGIGSSREQAVWALQDYGFRVVISSRFGDIFRSNAGKAGLLAAVVAEAQVEALWDVIDADPGIRLTVDLEAQTIEVDGQPERAPIPFDIAPDTRERLLKGLDEIGTTLQHAEDIAAFEARRSPLKPVVPRGTTTS